MTDKEEERKEESDDEDDEELSDEERWKRRYLRKIAEQAAKKFEKGRKVDKGFEGAFGGQENAYKYYRHHSNAFKYAAEPKDKVPKTKPLGKPPEGLTEPSRWIPPKPTEEYPPRKDPTETLQIHEKPITEHGRREQSDSKNQNDLREADALLNDDYLEKETMDDISAERVATVEVETPLQGAQDIASKIASGLEKAGYEHLSTEIEKPDTEELARIEAEARQDYAPPEEQLSEFLDILDNPEKVDELLGVKPEINPDITLAQTELDDTESFISPLELNETHEKLRRKAIDEVLEEQRLELLDDFELGPEHVDVPEEEYY